MSVVLGQTSALVTLPRSSTAVGQKDFGIGYGGGGRRDDEEDEEEGMAL